jgi:hypothetical protein
MKKPVKLFALFLMPVFLTSCGQNQTNAPKDNIKSETKDIVTSPGSNDPNVHTKYEYTDSIGKRLIIQNGFPRGGMKYTDPNGEVYGYVIFWTQIINETDNPLELNINFPVDSYEHPYLPGKYFKILVPADTMTIDKEPLYDYGLTIKSFLDNNRHQSSSLKRIINPKGSSTFYVVTLSNRGIGGIIRAGLSLKEQNLFYRINDKEIHCGKINLKNLRL